MEGAREATPLRVGTLRVGRVASPAVLIVIDLSVASVSLRQPDEFTRFSVEVAGEGDLAAVLLAGGEQSVGGVAEPESLGVQVSLRSSRMLRPRRHVLIRT